MAEAADQANYTMNFGPQHPAAHGVLRLVLEMDGEVVERADPHIGLLHRGTEKLIEYKTYLQAMPYFDRLDYVSPMCQEHAFVLAVEKLLGHRGAAARPVHPRAVRRDHPHPQPPAQHPAPTRMDVGAMTPFLWGFEEREKLMEFYERVIGRAAACRLLPPRRRASGPAGRARRRHRAPGPRSFPKVHRRHRGAADREPHLQAAHRRYRHGVSAKDALDWGFTGPMLRASGVPGTCARRSPTRSMTGWSSTIPIGKNGDCYDRYLVRIEEMRQSVQHHPAVPGGDAGRAGQGRTTARSRRRRAPR